MIFNEEFTPDDSPLDTTNVTTTLLYYSEEELAEFKKLCKRGMSNMYGHTESRVAANVSDFILHLLRQQYADVNATS